MVLPNGLYDFDHECPQKSSSVIFPSCSSTDERRFHTLCLSMHSILHIDFACDGLMIGRGMEHFVCEYQENDIAEYAGRFAIFSDLPFFLYNDWKEGMTYRIETKSGRSTLLGRTTRALSSEGRQAGEARIIYGPQSGYTGYCMAMALGGVVKRTPGLRECWRTTVPMDLVLAIRDAGLANDTERCEQLKREAQAVHEAVCKKEQEEKQQAAGRLFVRKPEGKKGE